MHIEFFVEEPSAEAVLQNIVPNIVGPAVSFSIHSFQGKPDLLRSLPGRLRGYRNWLPEDWRIVVLIDTDQDDCYELKARLEDIALSSGLLTKSSPGREGNFHVLNRLAVEELEAWFFGEGGRFGFASRRGGASGSTGDRRANAPGMDYIDSANRRFPGPSPAHVSTSPGIPESR